MWIGLQVREGLHRLLPRDPAGAEINAASVCCSSESNSSVRGPALSLKAALLAHLASTRAASRHSRARSRSPPSVRASEDRNASDPSDMQHRGVRQVEGGAPGAPLATAAISATGPQQDLSEGYLSLLWLRAGLRANAVCHLRCQCFLCSPCQSVLPELCNCLSQKICMPHLNQSFSVSGI
jgi:hypothetical protein